MAYTSDSEFDSETRVQLTNEVPPMDIFEQLNSVLQNDIWKWLLGWTEVTPGLPYKEAPSNVELDEWTKDEYPQKVVNGVAAPEYGPKPTQKWNGNPDKKDELGNPISVGYHTEIPKNCTRLEVDGTILPEHDLFLHEIYRYMENLYPDHPDWVELLTHAEIVDAFESAAAMVDYKPDDKFFTLVADNLATLDLHTDPAREELKLLLRNLKSNAYRRKFYGSTTGLKMIASGIYERSSVFPVGKYLPLKAAEAPELKPATDEELNSLKTREVDTFDPNWGKNFRIIDWHGTSRDIVEKALKTYSCRGTTYLGKEFSVIELSDKVLTPETSVVMQVPSNLSIKNTDVQEEGIIYTSTKNEPQRRLKSTAILNDDGTVTAKTEETSQVFSRTSSRKLPLLYKKLLSLGSVEELQKDLDERGDVPKYLITSARSCVFNSDDNGVIDDSEQMVQTRLTTVFTNSMKQGFDITSDRKSYDVLPCPFVENTVSLPIDKLLTMYDGLPSYSMNPIDHNISLDKDTLSDKIEPKVGELLMTPDALSVAQVSGYNKGIFEFRFMNKPDASSYAGIDCKRWFDELGHEVQSKEIFGLKLKTPTGHIVVALGKLTTHWELSANYAKCTGGELQVEKIPEYLPESMLMFLDKHFENLYAERARLTDSLEDYEEGSDTYKKIQTRINDINEEFRKASINKEYFYETLSYKDTKGQKHSYLSSLVNQGTSLLEVFQVSHVASSTDLAFAKAPEFIDKGELTAVDFGTISLYSVSSETEILSFANPEVTYSQYSKYYKPVKDSSLHLLKNSYLYIPTLKDEFFNLPRKSFNELCPGCPDSHLYEYFWGIKKNDNFVMSELETYSVEIEAVSNKTASSDDADYLLSFEGEENRRKFDVLTVGDLVSGSGLKDGTYITKLGNYTAVLSSKIPHSGTYVYKFGCAVNGYPHDVSEDFSNYKRQLLKYDSTSVSDPWQNGLYGSVQWPRVARTFIDGLADPQNFRPYNEYNAFTAVVKYLYSHKISEEDSKVIYPSVVSLDRNSFYELSLNHLINVKNRVGHEGNLMNVDWLDYIEENVSKAIQAKDTISIGTNLMMQTDMSGYYSLIKEKKYTDDDVKLKFQTFNWTAASIPAYAQIGSAGATRANWFKSIDDIPYPNVYGATFFDEHTEGGTEPLQEELAEGQGEWRRRQVYSISDNFGKDEAEKEVRNEHEVESLVAEVPLGEYDIQKDYEANNQVSTTVSVSFEKQSYKDLSKEKENAVRINNSSIFTKSCFEGLSEDEIVYFDPEEKETAKLPKFQEVYDKEVSTQFVEPDEGLETPYPINSYLHIEKGFASTYKDSEDKITADNFSLLIKDSDRWTTYKLVFGGVSTSEALYEYIEKTKEYILYYDWMKDTSKDENGELHGLTDRIAERAIKTILSVVAVNNKDERKTLNKNLLKLFTELHYIPVVRIVDISTVDSSKKAKSEADYFALVPLFGTPEKGKANCIGYVPARISNTIFNSSVAFNYHLITQEKEYKTFLSTQSEYFIATPQWPEQKFTKLSIESGALSYVEDRQSTFTLPRRCITDGSYQIDYTIDPHFLADGLFYDKDGKTITSSKCKFCVSQNPLYYDRDNKSFYMNSPDIYQDNTLLKNDRRVALTFKEQRFFKETKTLTASYKLTPTQQSLSDETKLVASVTSIDGIDFDLSEMSSSDRFITMEPVELRSAYSSVLEPKMFSNYSAIEGEIYGITPNNDFMISSMRSKEDEVRTENSLKLKQELSRIMPAVRMPDGNLVMNSEFNSDAEIVLNPGYAGYSDINFVEPEIKCPLTNDDVLLDKEHADLPSTDFKYYKNYLIIQGNVDLSNGARFVSDTLPQFTSALDKLNSGDEIKAIAQLSGSSATTIHPVELLLKTNGAPVSIPNSALVKYENNKVVVVTNTPTIYYSDPIADLSTVPSVELNSVSMDALTSYTTNLHAVDVWFDPETQKWGANYDIEGEKLENEPIRNSVVISWDDGNEFKQAQEDFNYAPDPEGIDQAVLNTNTVKCKSAYGDDIYLVKIIDKGTEKYVNRDDICLRTYRIVNNESVLYGFTKDGKTYYWESETLDKSSEVPHIPKEWIIDEEPDPDYTPVEKTFEDEAGEKHTVTLYRWKVTMPELQMEEGPVSSTATSQKLYAPGSKADVYVEDDSIYVRTKIFTYYYDSSKTCYTDEKTEEKHWLKATLPSYRDNTRIIIESRPVEQAELYVRARFDSLLKGIANTKYGWGCRRPSEWDEENPNWDETSEWDWYPFSFPKFTFRGVKERDEFIKVVSKIHLASFEDFKANRKEEADTYSLTGDFVVPATVSNGVYTIDLTLSGSSFANNVKFTRIWDNPSRTEEQYVAEYNNYLLIMMKDLMGTGDYEGLKSSLVSTLVSTDNKITLNLMTGNSISISTQKVCEAKFLGSDRCWSSMQLPIWTTHTVRATESDLKDYSILAPTMRVNWKGVVSELSVTSSSKPANTFTITHTFVKDGIAYYGGYWLSKEQFNKMTTLPASKRNDYLQYLSEKVSPFLAYSEDGSSLKLIRSQTAFAAEGDLKTREYKVASISSINDKILYTIRDGLNVYEKFLIVSLNEGKVVDTATFDADMKLAPHFGTFEEAAYKNGESTLKTSDGHAVSLSPAELADSSQKQAGTGNDIISTPGSSTIRYLTPVPLNIPANLQVQSVSDFGFTLSNSIATEGAAGDAKLLFAIKTRTQISKQEDYISDAYVESYMNSTGLWKVPLVEEVKSATTADKMYSLRECRMPGTVQSVEVGYPAIDEDTGHIYYKYNTSTSVDDDGQSTVVYTPQVLKNDAGNDVFLCNETGLLTALDVPFEDRDASSYIPLNELITSKMSKRKASVVVATNLDDLPPSILKEDKDLNAYIKSKNLRFNSVKLAYKRLDTPFFTVDVKTDGVDVDITDFDDYLIYMDKDAYAFWANNSFNSSYQLSADYKEEYEPYIQTLRVVISWVEEMYGSFGSFYNTNTWYQRLIENNGYLFDKVSGCYLFSKVRKFFSNLQMPYVCIDSGNNVYSDSMLSVAEDDHRVLVTDRAVNGIYLPVKGYGDKANSTHKDWGVELPWTTDPAAFYEEDLYNSLGQPVYLCDEHGAAYLTSGSKIIMKAPKYQSFQQLIRQLGRTIVTNNDSLVKTYKANGLFAKIKDISTDGSTFTFEKPIDFDAKLEPNKDYFFKFKILTTSTVHNSSTVKNNPEFFEEVSKDDITEFPPDRVYFETDGLPQPPVTNKGIIYNKQNSKYFYSSSYKNSNGEPIYMCDENGCLVTPTIEEGQVVFTKRLDRNRDGDCSGSINYNVDRRFNPRTPIYNTCEEWLKNDFYVSGQERNPFWQVLKIYPKYNESTKKFTASSKIISYEKNGFDMMETEVKPEDQYFKVHNVTYRKNYGGNIESIPDYTFLDLNTGEVRFLAENPDEKWSSAPSLVMYGITYSNTFYNPETSKKPVVVESDDSQSISLKNVWQSDGFADVDSFIKTSYTVNSKEDLSDPKNKDAAIAQITEFALLDKNRNIIAYALFPPIEYRTDRQHISFTCFINKDNLVDDSEENN